MFCPNCGTELPDGSKFCGNCGTPVGGERKSGYEPPYEDAIRELESGMPAPKKKSGVGKAIIIGLLAVAVLGVAAASINGIKGFLDRTGNGGKTEPAVTVPAKPAGTTGQTGTAGQTGTSSQTGTTNPNGAANTAGSGGETVPEWNEKWLLGEDTPENTGSAVNYSTDALPTAEDFFWFYNHEANTVNAAVPAGAEEITDPSRLTGGWRCLAVRTPNTSPIREYWNIELRVDGSEVNAVQRWSGKVENGGAFEDLSSANSNPMTGHFDERGILYLEDEFGSELVIVQWYEYDGKQYGMGTYECGWDSKDALGLLAVCRP